MTGTMPDHLEALDDLKCISSILTIMSATNEDFFGMPDALAFLGRVVENRTEILKFYVDNENNKSDECKEAEEDTEEE